MNEKLITFFKEKKWWFDDAAESYGELLSTIGIAQNSLPWMFYVHVEDGPSFLSDKGEIYQLGWHAENTNYVANSNNLKSALGLSDALIPLDAFAGGSGFFYNKETESVVYLEMGQILDSYKKGDVAVSWPDFDSFLEWYFGR
ncbi:hypothetical protein [Chitinibacter sp. ZOR0017]|uniref:hypothetical protein n=1 Tax=Chitinibacter sp. ZOR0017 TaxID=1339254 RepID=UPI00064745D4|nr:hypothetical protein [Chitinibacter sp. ZOR0017]